MKDKIRVSMFQMEILSGTGGPKNKSVNLSRALEFIENSSDADLYVLPDEFYAGYGYGLSSMPDFTKKKCLEKFCELAAKKSVYIAFSCLIQSEGLKRFKSHSCGMLIGPAGVVECVQKRSYIFQREREWVVPCEDEKVEVFHTPLGSIAFVIGFDTVHQDVWDKIFADQPDIVINPLYYIKQHAHVMENNLDPDFFDYSVYYDAAVRYHAMRGNCFVLSCSGVGSYGPQMKYRAAGGTKVIFPQGKVIPAASEDKECVLHVTLLKEDLMKCRDLAHQTVPDG